MSDGSQKLVKDIKKGDLVKTLRNGVESDANVLCLLRFRIQNGQKHICKFADSGLEITPGHPMIYQGNWVLPRDIQKSQLVACEEVYNIVVDSGHIIFVNGVGVILPGHNYKNSVLKNDYLGSQEVINDLSKMPGWNSGFLDLVGDLGKK